jgi:hypothetical protein
MPDAPKPANTDVVEHAKKIVLQEAEQENALFGTSEGSQRNLGRKSGRG